MAPPADEMMGTRARRLKLVIPHTTQPKRTLPMQIMLRMDQLTSKKTDDVDDDIFGRVLRISESSVGS